MNWYYPTIKLNHGGYRKAISIGYYTSDPAGGRSEWNVSLQLMPDEARYLAQELIKAANQIDGRGKAISAMGRIRKNTAKIAKAAKAEAME